MDFKITKQLLNYLLRFRCPKCEFNTIDPILIQEHLFQAKCCPVCGLLINSKRFNFQQHLMIHTNEKPFNCKICNRSFRQKNHLAKHTMRHRTKGQIIF